MFKQFYPETSEFSAASHPDSNKTLFSVKPYFRAAPDENISLNEGETGVLKCQFGGSPQPIISWERSNGKKISQKMIETGDGTLKIPDLSVEDQDIYICRASNSAGVISNEISLRIRRGPKFVIKPQNKTVKIGEEVQFEWWVFEILIGGRRMAAQALRADRLFDELEFNNENTVGL